MHGRDLGDLCGGEGEGCCGYLLSGCQGCRCWWLVGGERGRSPFFRSPAVICWLVEWNRLMILRMAVPC